MLCFQYYIQYICLTAVVALYYGQVGHHLVTIILVTKTFKYSFNVLLL